jgi:hypothetical protein
MILRPASDEDRWIRILLLVLTAGALVPIWAAPVPPLQDLPNHLLKVDIFERFARGEDGVRQIYALNLGPLANYTCYVVLLLLAPFVGLITAARILLSIIVAALPWAAYGFLRRVQPEGGLFALAVPAMSFNLFLMMGNLNFCLGLALYLAALTVFASRGPAQAPAATARARTDWGFGLLATTLYFTHGFVFLILVGVVTLLLVADFSAVRARRACGLVPGILLLVANIALNLGSGTTAGAFRPDLEPPGLDSIRVAVVWLLNPHGWGFDTWLGLAWLAVILLCTVSTLAGILGRWRAGVRFLALLRENVWLALALLLAAGYFVAPTQLRDWFHLRMRFSPLAVLTLLGGLAAPSRKTARAAVIAVLVLAAIGIEARNALEFVRRGSQVQEYLSGVDAVEEGAAILAMENLEEGPKYRDNLYSWAYYAIARGGWGPYLHVQPSYNPIVYKVAPWAPAEGRPPGDEGDTRRIAACYDYVLFWDPKPEDATALRPYFEIVRTASRLLVLRNLAGVRRSTPASNPDCRSHS